jgi:signal transduction histidine kinase
MRDGGTLTVRVTADGSHAKIVVADTGAGIVPEIQDRMFEPFFTTKEVGEGSGLGLSIVHGIVQQLNGAIEIHSQPGQGSSFTIHLPLNPSRETT